MRHFLRLWPSLARHTDEPLKAAMSQTPPKTGMAIPPPLQEDERIKYARETLNDFRAWWDTRPRQDDWWMVQVDTWLANRAKE